MNISNLNKMKLGWFIGDFEPSVLKTKDFEVAVKNYCPGVVEKKHMHKIATEITVVISGTANINGVEITDGDIVVLHPGEESVFETMSECSTVVVKMPSIIGDKFLI